MPGDVKNSVKNTAGAFKGNAWCNAEDNYNCSTATQYLADGTSCAVSTTKVASTTTTTTTTLMTCAELESQLLNKFDVSTTSDTSCQNAARDSDAGQCESHYSPTSDHNPCEGSWSFQMCKHDVDGNACSAESDKTVINGCYLASLNDCDFLD